jgi:protein-tyrosine phosphatase
LFNRILTVCTGNICRSPAAQYILLQRLQKVDGWQGTVRSAGIGALVNHPADETMLAMMHEQGVDLGPHRATQLTLEHLRWADLVLVMEEHHRQAVLKLDLTARGKTFLLGHWMADTEIPDPYRQGDEVHANALRLIHEAIALWIEKLKK